METGEARRDALEAREAAGRCGGDTGDAGRHRLSNMSHRLLCIGERSVEPPVSVRSLEGSRRLVPGLRRSSPGGGRVRLFYLTVVVNGTLSDLRSPRAGPAVIRVGLARGDGRRAPASRSVTLTAFKRDVRRARLLNLHVRAGPLISTLQIWQPVAGLAILTFRHYDISQGYP